jgi:Ca2+-binding EF-hand superfamily protein
MNNRFLQAKVDVSNDPNDVEDRIRSIVVMKRVRIEEFFIDFDKLRKGRVTRRQFKSILSNMNFALTDDEFEALADKYKTNDPEVFFNYVDFTHSINKAFTIRGIDKCPSTRVAPLTKEDTFLARRKYLGNHDGEIQSVLDHFREAIKTQRMHLKPVFQDFDITKNGHVTKHQFLRVLNNLRIQTPEEITQFILRRYMDKGNVDEVNYVDFCEEVDGTDQLYGAGRDFNHSHDYYPKTTARIVGNTIVANCPDDLHDVLARIRTVTCQQRIRLGEFFRDFDKLRSGFITAAQFRIGLNMGKLPISQGEFNMLCEYFKAPKAGDHIQWTKFCDAVDEVFTKKHLEKDLDTTLGDARTHTVYGRAPATGIDQDHVNRILSGFTEVIRK